MSDGRVKVAVTGFVYGYLNDGEDLVAAQRRIALEAETRANLPGDIRLHLSLTVSPDECAYCAAGSPSVQGADGFIHVLAMSGDRSGVRKDTVPCTRKQVAINILPNNAR